MIQTRKNPRAVGAAGGFQNHSAQNQYSSHLPPFEKVIAVIQDVRFLGKHKARGLCPLHGGHSLEVIEFESGKVYLQCWGCDARAPELCPALGLKMADLFPSDPTWKPDPSRPRITREIREELKVDAWVAHIYVNDAAKGRAISRLDAARTSQAVSRLHQYDPQFFDRAHWVYREVRA
ncbi:hypothetical protein [Microbulbifer sp.]|uniref:hypothetical protein n=1 Tax=Microbulbifer sp. TaxID=1908541 RepID=UPI002582ED92|nr:hypothetical protein [Microbulbifer sp.]